MQSETRQCQNCKKDFTIEPEDFNFYEKIKVPPPTFCFECRLQRKMARRNERSFYKRECDLCHSSIVSMYPADVPFPVYCPKCWWGDGWDPLSYEREYDFSKNFFEQWKEFCLTVPRIALYQKNPVNSPYTNHSENLKNSYLALNCGYSENIFYSKWVLNAKDLTDCLVTFNSELCYELLYCKGCSNCLFCYRSKNCLDSSYLYDCNDCVKCFLSSNLRNKKYCFMNKQLTKEEYEKAVSPFLGSLSGHEKAMKLYKEEVLSMAIRKYMVCGKEVNSSGDYIFGGSKNLKKCFRIYRSEDCTYCADSADLKDCYDVYESALPGCEQQYECHAGNHLSFSKFCSISYDSHNLEYSEMCHGSENLFGCVALKKKKYCVLNKQYSKEEYEALVEKIKKQMEEISYSDMKGRVYKYGEFFPIELSPFYYNETVAQEYFPLTREQALSEGYKWKEKEERNYKVEIKPKNIPDNINDTEESMVGKAIECAHHEKDSHLDFKCDEACTEAFKVVPEEFTFYKRMNLPFPRLCPNCRHYVRQKQINPMKLWHRSCMCEKEGHDHEGKCSNEFETSYAPDRPEIVYCESCYQKEVY